MCPRGPVEGRSIVAADSLGSVDSYHASHSTSNIIGTETASTVTTRGIYTEFSADRAGLGQTQ